MKTPIQEAVAQVFFWTGVGCFPLAVVVFYAAFQSRDRLKTLPLFVLGGVCLTHFAWYCNYLGVGLATKVGEFHPAPWWKFLPIGLVAAAILSRIRYSGRRKK